MKWMVMGNCELQRVDRTCQRPGNVARDRFSEFFFRAIAHFRLPSQDLGLKLRAIESLVRYFRVIREPAFRLAKAVLDGS
jgi:hypothetical protein